MKKSITSIEPKELDAWVAKALGVKILGEALAYYDPESGTPCLDYDQKESRNSILGTHKRYFGIKECNCEIYEQIEKDTLEILSKEGLEHSIKEEEKLFDHYMGCLVPVYDYSTNFSYGMDIVREERISLIAEEIEGWVAYKDGVSSSAKTELRAAMQVFVILKYGDMLDEEELCM